MHMLLASPWGQPQSNQGNAWENIFICIYSHVYIYIYFFLILFFPFFLQLYANKVVMIKGDGGFFCQKSRHVC